MRALSLAALTVLGVSPPEQVRIAAACGLPHVGLRLLPATPEERVWDIVGDTALARETKAVLSATGISVLDVEILRLKPDTVVSDWLPLLDSAAAFGARHLLVAGNDPDEPRLTANLRALCEAAAPRGLRCCVEAMPWTDVRDLLQAVRVAEACDHPAAGVLVDPIHFDRGGNSPAQLAAVAPCLLPYLQFCDAPAARPTELAELLRQARAARLPPGEGGLDLAGLLRAAPPAVPLALEVPMTDTRAPAERARAVVDATRRWLAGHAAG